ncbi:hypothetical protein COCVIDRAFT_93817 [Bipolaris victoriae FI3]|uniref:Uncharacterized protein n=1 Tax=Bipolaris victoriae (strain FI3) TaxID=930091 RepID=W7EYR5_BIPV3|nr:hypothetical protein COCVIDRAFT_93817 [Bipolaris victoriae FI3]
MRVHLKKYFLAPNPPYSNQDIKEKVAHIKIFNPTASEKNSIVHSMPRKKRIQS